MLEEAHEKSPPVLGRRARSKSSIYWLEAENSAEAHNATGSSRAGRRSVKAKAEGPDIVTHAGIFRADIDVGVVEMVQGVGCGHARLEVVAFADFPVLANRQIETVGARISFSVPGSVAERSTEDSLRGDHVDDVFNIVGCDSGGGAGRSAKDATAWVATLGSVKRIDADQRVVSADSRALRTANQSDNL